MALAALCGDDTDGRTWAQTLQARFDGEGALAGHAVGNLLIAGLWQEMRDPVAGLDMVARLLNTCGRVLPMSTKPLSIEADVLGLDPMRPDEICTLTGQATVAKTRAEVQHVRIVPDPAPATPEALTSVAAADFVILGPGSWFTSVIPHLLVPELAESIYSTTAKRILTMNIEPAAETDGFSASRHVELLAEHAPALRLDYVIVDEGFAERDRHLATYVSSVGAELIVANVSMRDGSARHDPFRLAATYADVMGA